MTAKGWRSLKLVELAAKKRWALNGGPFGSKLTTKHYTDVGVPIIRGTNVSGPSKFSLDDFVFVSEEKADELLANNAHPGDLIFTQRGTIGQVGLVPSNSRYPRFVISQSQMKLTPDTERADASFLYYLFRAPTTIRKLQDLAFAAGVPHINLEILRQFEIVLPELNEQRRIAGLLSAYDELIEDNFRRIRILEKIARATYREWFVHFRFPKHEGLAIVDLPPGRIPEGWEVRNLSEVAAVNRAQINGRSAPEELHYVDISSVSPGRIDGTTTYPFSEAPGRARRIVTHGDVIWSCVRPNRRSHALVINPRPNTIASTGFAVLSAKSVPFTYLYLATTTDEFVAYLANNATGAAYPAVTARTFERASVLVPPKPLLDHFAAATMPMAELVDVLDRQNTILRASRDLLLPRLMSGRLSLAEAEAAV